MFNWSRDRDRKVKRAPMPERFNELAVYNSEKARGIVHTAHHRGRMARLQADFDNWSASLER